MYTLLIEFFVNKWKSRDLNSAKTISNYFQSLKREFKILFEYDINLTTGVVFHNSGIGIYFVIDNIFKEIPTQWKTSESNNVLSTADVNKLYNSEMLSENDPLWFITRLIFEIAFVTWWRPGMFYNVEVSDFQLTERRGNNVYKITNRIETLNWSKIAHWSLRSVKDKVMTVKIWK